MQTCKFSLTLNPFNVMFVRGITPAELTILQQIHFKESSGSPIGEDLQLEPGEALTVDLEGKAAEPEYFHQGTGKTVPFKPAEPPVTHVRTNREELERLRKKYRCAIPHIPGSKNAVNEIYGTTPNVRLPETFDEVLSSMGLVDETTGKPLILPADVSLPDNQEARDLEGKTRAELVQMAIPLKLTVRPSETKEALIAKIIKAQAPV